MSELLILIDGNEVGRIRAEKGGRLTLDYDASWRTSAEGHSLSVTMPLASVSHPHKAVLPYLWNLLPENPNVLQRWGQQFHVSPANPFKLLGYVGEDAPGAAQFVTPDRLEGIQQSKKLTVQWITDDELAERLRQLRNDVTAIRRPGDIGKMSLPGAQAKTAFYYDEKKQRWGVPGGRTPTTHIIKPCMPGFDGLVENEHLCMEIAAGIGMEVARSSVLVLGDDTYIVVERYDRLPSATGSAVVRRVHQEDVCQALGLMPAQKYQEEGGPGIAQIVRLIRRVSSAPQHDVDRFLQANIFNWLIGGTDAHSKNYSLLIAAGDDVRLAPLYDISSQLPYPDLVDQRVSMKIGDHYGIAQIGLADWRKLWRDCAVDEERMVALLEDTALALPDQISIARRRAIADGLSRRIVGPLADLLLAHVRARGAAIFKG